MNFLILKKKEEEFPDTVTQEELLDKKKREREKLGSVNLIADEETSKYEDEIKKNGKGQTRSCNRYN